jgi:hypothetical protein
MVLTAVEGVFKLIGAVAKLMEPFDLMFHLFGAVADMIHDLVTAISKKWNKLIEFVAKWIRKIPGKGDKWADELLKSKIDIKKGDSFGFDVEMQDFTESVGDAADAAKELTESLLNAPQGFKIAAYRFNAQAAQETLGGTLGTPIGFNDAPAAGPTMNIGTINVQADNPQELLAAIEQEAGFNRFATTGSSQEGGGAFSLVRPK